MPGSSLFVNYQGRSIRLQYSSRPHGVTTSFLASMTPLNDASSRTRVSPATAQVSNLHVHRPRAVRHQYRRDGWPGDARLVSRHGDRRKKSTEATTAAHNELAMNFCVDWVRS